MAVDNSDVATLDPVGREGRCPIDHGSLRQGKTAQVVEPDGRPLERDAAGVWHVRGYAQARAILRSSAINRSAKASINGR